MVRTWYNFLDSWMDWTVEAVACNQWMCVAITWNPLSSNVNLCIGVWS